MRIDLIPDVPEEPEGGDRKVIISSAKKEIKATLPESAVSGESPYQALLQSVYDSALITDLAGKIVDVNVRAQEKLLYERDELCDLSVLDLVSGADESLIETLLQNLEEDRFTLIQASCLRGDGTYFPAEIAVNKLNLGEMHLCFFMRDITIRVQREQMLRTTYNAIQNSGDGIAVSNHESKFEYVNAALVSMWGYRDVDELLDQDINVLMKENSVMDKILTKIASGEQSIVREGIAVKKDGLEFNVQISAAANYNSDGEQVGMIFSFVDISDRKRAEEAEREAEQRRVMLESLGAACHHLGQPATVLLGNLGIIQKKIADSDDALKELVQSSIEAMETMSDILYKLNTVNEYKTTQYLEKPAGEDSEESRILEI